MGKVDFIQKQWEPNYSWVLDCSVLVTLAAFVLYTASKHEPWADEAQAWLLARDFSWWRLVLSELRYEGHPPVWFAILSIAIHLFHMPYGYLAYLSGSIAIVGLAVLVFLAPFPRILRYLIAFSFFFVYQYAVIARPYALIPLLAFLAAHFYRKGLPNIMTFAAVIALLIQVSSYAAVIAAALSTFYGFQLIVRWREISAADRRRVFAAAALIAFSLLMLVVILYPPADSSLVAGARAKTLQHDLRLAGAGLVGAFADSPMVTIAFLICVAVWAWQRGALLLLVLGVGGTTLEYGLLQGYGHHQGLITIALVLLLWAVWPTRNEAAKLTREECWVQQAVLAAAVLIFGWHCTWSYSAMVNDWAGPYSGALDAAQFLKSVHADKAGCNGYLFWSVGVQPYFDHNIFLNYGGPAAPASYHFSHAFEARAKVVSDSDIQNGPAFLVVAPEVTAAEAAAPIGELRSRGYILVHYSDGRRFFKRGFQLHAPYLIFEKADFVWSTQRP